VVQENDIYDTRLHLIFYDDPIFGPYERHFRAIFAEPRYTDIRANLRYVADLYRRIAASHSAGGDASATKSSDAGGDFATFAHLYYEHIAAESASMEAKLTALSAPPFAAMHRP